MIYVPMNPGSNLDKFSYWNSTLFIPDNNQSRKTAEHNEKIFPTKHNEVKNPAYEYNSDEDAS